MPGAMPRVRGKREKEQENRQFLFLRYSYECGTGKKLSKPN